VEARQILAKFHSRNSDVNSPIIQLEMEEIEEHISLNGSDKRWWDFRTLFQTVSDRYRTGVVCMVGEFSMKQSTKFLRTEEVIAMSNFLAH